MFDFRFDNNIPVMKSFPDKFFDLAPVDPEYGIGESSKNHKSRNTPVKQRSGKLIRPKNKNYTRKEWDNQPPTFEYFKELFRVSVNQIIFGANYFTEIVGETFKPPRRAQFQQFIKDHPRGWIIWDKMNAENDFNDCELIWTSFDFPSRIYVYMWAGMMQGKSMLNGHVQQGNKKLNETRIHVTQKPVILYKYLYHSFAKKDWKILDTHLGSRSSAIAALHYGIENFVGIENDQENFDLGQLRFNVEFRKHKLQLTQHKLSL